MCEAKLVAILLLLENDYQAVCWDFVQYCYFIYQAISQYPFFTTTCYNNLPVVLNLILFVAGGIPMVTLFKRYPSHSFAHDSICNFGGYFKEAIVACSALAKTITLDFSGTKFKRDLILLLHDYDHCWALFVHISLDDLVFLYMYIYIYTYSLLIVTYVFRIAAFVVTV